MRRHLIASAVAAGVLSLVSAWPAAAQTVAPPPQEPMLRIDPGMHTAPVKRIGVNDACTLLVTGSDDKTVRLWSLPEGRLLRTIRPATGFGNDGRIYSVAMSPDGRTIAAGGWDGAYSVDRGHYVHLFDSSNGRLIRRLGKLGNVVNQLSFSPDGRYLAAGLGLGEGVRVYDTASWNLIMTDKEYGQDHAIYGTAFDSRNRLFTSYYDGNLRRYGGPNFELERKVRAASGARPFSIAAHPTSARLAVGYEDSAVVDVYDTNSMQQLFAPDVKGVDHGNLTAAGWSRDGRRLYSGGRFGPDGQFPIRMWDNEGRGDGRNLRGSRDTMMVVTPCGDNMAFVAQDPVFGLIRLNGEPIVRIESVKPDYRGKRAEHFTVSPDGTRLRFGLGEWSEEPVLFDLLKGQLTQSPTPVAGLLPPLVEGVPVTNWINNRNPQLAGKPFKLEAYEEGRSLAITQDKSRFVLGLNWSIKAYRKDGTEIWTKQAPGVVWGVHIPRDGGVVLAAYGDGTIRWHRLTDGQELLALFVTRKDNRWVAWTPKGYYTASAGAESLIGWHVNRGWNEVADYFPADRFREQFNRPDIVRAVLATRDENEAIAEASRKSGQRRQDPVLREILPPVIEIMDPRPDATFRTQEVTLTYLARNPSGQLITDIEVQVDGQKLGTRGAVPRDASGTTPITFKVAVPPRDVNVTLIARSGDKFREPATIRLRWDGAKLTTAPGPSAKPRMRAVFVGISKYQQAGLNLDYPAKDATDMHNLLKAQEGKVYSQVEARLLANADRRTIISALQWLEESAKEGDVSVIFIAGHGVTDAQQRFFFLPTDFNERELKATTVSALDLISTVRNMRGRVTVFLDACHSGNAFAKATGGDSLVSADLTRISNELSSAENGVMMYAASTGRQEALEDPKWGNGAFTKAVLEGLAGAADYNRDGIIETDELGLFVRRRVLELTNRAQEPISLKSRPITEFTLAAIR